jgi:hypothetical protein
MRFLLILIAIGYSSIAFAQAPSINAKRQLHAGAQEPTGCKHVGTVKGIKLWAGDCVSSNELRASAPASEAQQPPSDGAETAPPGQTH